MYDLGAKLHNAYLSDYREFSRNYSSNSEV